MPPCFGMGAFFWRARLRFALASCGALRSARDCSGGGALGGVRGATSWGEPERAKGEPEWAKGGQGRAGDEPRRPLRTGSAPGHMKRKTMSAHFATAPYTVSVNVNGV